MKSEAPAILVVNPGSTSTKIALFHGMRCVFETTKTHTRKSLDACKWFIDQAGYREKIVRKELKQQGVALKGIAVFAARGGLLRPVSSGVYAVNETMIKDLSSCRYGEHASNLGAIIAHNMAVEAGAGAYIADPVVVDELDPVARLTGHPDIPRRSVFHALSQKAVAEKTAKKLRKPYRKCNLIAAHIGGGVSIGVHKKGRVVDVNNALEGDGPFSPERTGSLPVLDFYRYARKRRMSVKEVADMVTRGGGLLGHLGTNDCRRIEKRALAGDTQYRLVYDAFVYQIARAIGAGAAALAGNVDAIVLTGNVLKSELFRRKLRRMVRFIGPVFVFTENLEMETLAGMAMEVYQGRRKVRVY